MNSLDNAEQVLEMYKVHQSLVVFLQVTQVPAQQLLLGSKITTQIFHKFNLISGTPEKEEQKRSTEFASGKSDWPW